MCKEQKRRFAGVKKAILHDEERLEINCSMETLNSKRIAVESILQLQPEQASASCCVTGGEGRKGVDWNELVSISCVVRHLHHSLRADVESAKSSSVFFNQGKGYMPVPE